MSFHLSTHASLLARLGVADDDDAWREFFDRYHALIHHFARSRGLQPIDADDLAQEVLMAVHQGICDFEYDPERGRFRGFLKTVALRAIWRRGARMRETDDETILERLGADPELEAQWEAEWRQYHLRLAIARAQAEYPPDQMRIFERLTSEAASTADVVRDTGLAATRVYQIKSTILARVRELVASQVAEEG